MFANFRTGNIDYYDGMEGEEARMAQQEFGDNSRKVISVEGRMTIDRRQMLIGMAGIAGLANLPSFALAAERDGVPGGELTIRLSADPPTFDALNSTASNVIAVLAPCYSKLIKFEEASPESIVGDLATEWSVSEDGLAYSFTLVDNAKFHDGVPLTSKDIKYTYDLIRNPPEGVVSVRRNLLSVIDTIDTPDDTTVVISLKQPSPALLTTLASGWMVILPQHLAAKRASLDYQIVGSGPFKIGPYTRGVSLTLERYEGYHVAGRPFLDAITFFIVPDIATSFNYLLSGQINVFNQFAAEDLERVERDHGDRVKVLHVPSLSGEGISLNITRAPFDDIRVREAISLAVNREEVLKVALGGAGIVTGFAAPGSWQLDPERLAAVSGFGADYEASLERAKVLLKEAGLEAGFTTKITCRSVPTHDARSIYLKDALSRLGIEVELDVQEAAAYSDALSQRNFDIITSQINGLGNDPDLFFGEYHTSNGSLNYSQVTSEALDELYNEQTVELDPVERKKLVDKLGIAALELFGQHVWYWKETFIGHSADVQDLHIHPQTDNVRQMVNVWKKA